MATPHENSLLGAVETLAKFNKVLDNCIATKEQPSEETINGILGLLESIRTSETRNIDRLEKGRTKFGTPTPYS